MCDDRKAETPNLLRNLPQSPDEVFEDLVASGSVRIERIVSRGQSSPDGFWYDQASHEWVALLEGAARLQFEDGLLVELGPGDHVNIPAGTRHRVAWTAPDRATVWLAVFYDD